MTSLEICVDSLESAIAAQAGGAQRIELCVSLVEGGLTPSLGLIRAVRSRIDISIYVMIRPRPGDFVYSDAELSVMREDIALAAQNGADGIVLGILTTVGDVDIERTRKLVDFARPMGVTFHRAIDMTRDVDASVEDVIRTGADRVLTSGGEPTAMQGRHRIGRFVKAAGGAIEIMAGGGVRAENAEEICRAAGVQAFHAALRRPVKSQMAFQRRKVHLGARVLDDTIHHVVSSADVRMLRQAIERANCGQIDREHSAVGNAT